MKKLCLVFLIACGSPQHAAPPPDAAPSRMVIDEKVAAQTAEGMIEMLQTMVAITKKHADDCDAMAADLEKVYAVAQPLFDVTAAAKGDPEATRLLKDAWNQREAEAGPLRDQLGDGLLVCKENANVVRAVRDMPTW